MLRPLGGVSNTFNAVGAVVADYEAFSGAAGKPFCVPVSFSCDGHLPNLEFTQ
jgi:hypothetical protein